jgi:hypothetical protein
MREIAQILTCFLATIGRHYKYSSGELLMIDSVMAMYEQDSHSEQDINRLKQAVTSVYREYSEKIRFGEESSPSRER